MKLVSYLFGLSLLVLVSGCDKTTSAVCKDLCEMQFKCAGESAPQHYIDNCADLCKAQIKAKGDTCEDAVRDLYDCLEGLTCAQASQCDDKDAEKETSCN